MAFIALARIEKHFAFASTQSQLEFKWAKSWGAEEWVV